MRTTLTLDKDIAIVIERMRRERRKGLKELINQALREGLKQMESHQSVGRVPYETKTVSMGLPLQGKIDDVAQVLAIAVGENFF